MSTATPPQLSRSVIKCASGSDCEYKCLWEGLEDQRFWSMRRTGRHVMWRWRVSFLHGKRASCDMTNILTSIYDHDDVNSRKCLYDIKSCLSWPMLQAYCNRVYEFVDQVKVEQVICLIGSITPQHEMFTSQIGEFTIKGNVSPLEQTQLNSQYSMNIISSLVNSIARSTRPFISYRWT